MCHLWHRFIVQVVVEKIDGVDDVRGFIVTYGFMSQCDERCKKGFLILD